MKMKIGKMIAMSGLAGLMCLGLGAAVAADKGMKHGSADFNKDGMVTEDEMMTHCRMSFMKMDKDNDHMVNHAEWDDEWFLDG